MSPRPKHTTISDSACMYNYLIILCGIIITLVDDGAA